MTTLADIREMFPQYAEVSDGELLMGLHRRFYPDMHVRDFVHSIEGGPTAMMQIPRGAMRDYWRENVILPRDGETQREAEIRAGGALFGNTGSGQGEAMLRSAGQGLMFGASDEITARGVSALSGNSYDYELARERERLDQGREDFPVATMLSEIGGAATTGAGLGYGAIPRAATLPQAMLSGALVGAGEGAVYDFNAGEGGFEERARRVPRGAAVGLLAGAAAPAVIAGVGQVARSVANPIGGMLNIGNESRATRQLMRALDASGAADDLAPRLRQAAAEGQPMFTVADAMGTEGQRSLSGVARQPGAGRQFAEEFLEARQIDQGDRVAGFLRDGLGVDDTADAATSRLTAARGAEADQLYSEARNGANAVDVRPAVGLIDERIGGMQGVDINGDGIDSVFARFRNRLASRDPSAASLGSTGVAAESGAEVTDIFLSDFDRVLGVRQDIGDAIGAAVRAGRNNEASQLQRLSRALDEALEAASDGYRAANDTFAQRSRVIDAIEAGRVANRPGQRTENVAARYGLLSDDARGAFRTGYSDPLMAQIENATPGTNVANRLRTSRQQGNLSAMADNPDTLLRQIDRENTMAETRRLATGGSQTATNIADQAAVNGDDISIFANLASGRPGAAAGQAAGRLLNAARGLNEPTREAIARMLLSSDPEAISRAIGAYQRAQARGLLASSAARGAGRTGGLLALEDRYVPQP